MAKPFFLLSTVVSFHIVYKLSPGVVKGFRNFEKTAGNISTDFVSNEGGQIDETNLQSYFDIGLQYVLTQVQYMFQMKYSTQSVTIWCKNLNYNDIMEKGYWNYKVLVGAYNTIYNNTHKPKRKIKLSNIQVTVQRRRAGDIQGMHMHI